MARGWESKAVESQIESRYDGPQRKTAQLSSEELQRIRERESVELSRVRVMQDLAAATNPRYKELLQRTLQYLDEKLAGMV